MKLLKIACFVLIFSLTTGFTAHKFYVSITKIEYVAEKQSLQIISKIFIDDIEDALQERYDPTISLAIKKETAAHEAFLKKYVQQKLQIKVNGKPVELEYIGKEYEVDIAKLYFEVTGVARLNELEIENQVLFDKFDEQQNIIHLKTTTNRRSLILDKDNPKGLLNFN